jgi:hypothetical protein
MGKSYHPENEDSLDWSSISELSDQDENVIVDDLKSIAQKIGIGKVI